MDKSYMNSNRWINADDGGSVAFYSVATDGSDTVKITVTEKDGSSSTVSFSNGLAGQEIASVFAAMRGYAAIRSDRYDLHEKQKDTQKDK